MTKRIGTNVEEYMRKQKANHLKHLIRQYGIRVQLLEPESTTYSKVYGTDSGENAKFNVVAEIDVVITPDDFFPVSQTAAGGFIEGWMYSNDPKIKVGQIVRIKSSEDSKTRDYRIESPWARGMTTDVFKRYKIAAMGG